MKKAISLCILGLFICSGLVVTAQPSENPLAKQVSVSFSQPTFENENTFVSISLNEADSYLMVQGKPMLPSYTETLAFPFASTITDVTVTPQGIHTQALTQDLAPTPAISIAGEDTAVSDVSLEYGTDPYPGTWFDYSVGCGLYDGVLQTIVTISIYPVNYQPVGRIVEWTSGATVSVSYIPGTPRPAPLDNYQLVVIGPDSYSSQIAPLITHKISRGITSKFVSLTDIYGGTYFPATGRDNQEKIKYFIKNAIENWGTGNVMLVGGISQLPARETHVYVSDDPEYGDEIFTSDLYYADIYNSTGGFASWDTNDNNIFGEYHWNGQTDAVDLHPDVYLARVPAISATQVTTVVNKIIGYETTPGYQQDWFLNLVLVGGDSFDDSGAINEGEYANQKVIDLMTGFIPNQQWVTNGMLSSLVPSGVANIKNAIGAGCGFVDFSGHGNTNIWATHPHQNFNSWLPTPAGGIRSNDISSLSNGNKLPIVTVEACDTARFADDTNCFNWAFLYSGSGGAIGTFGATGVGYSYVGTGVISGLVGKMGLNIYRGYKLDDATTFGELWGRALQRYITGSMNDGDYKTVEEWQPFGDPTLAIAEHSNPPVQPAAPTGTENGKVGTSYTYTTSTTDPDGDQVFYLFDWGDNTTSGWVGPLASGATASALKTWSAQGTYQVKVIAKDIHGVLSPWSDPLSVVMPLNYQPPVFHLLQWLLERFPNAFPLLRALLG